MKLNSKLTGGLAWAGLVVILAVPSADMLTRPQNAAAHITSDMDAVETASVESRPATGTPAVKAPVKLPSYVSSPATEVAGSKPATTVRLVAPAGPAATATPETTEVATVPAEVAPVPYPASMRPKPVETAPTETAAAGDEPLIIDEDLVARREAAVARVLDDNDFEVRPRVVTDDELEEWDSGSLAEYLERRGLLSEDEPQEADAGDYDSDGFFLDEGPNRDDERRVVRRVRPREFFFF